MEGGGGPCGAGHARRALLRQPSPPVCGSHRANNTPDPAVCSGKRPLFPLPSAEPPRSTAPRHPPSWSICNCKATKQQPGYNSTTCKGPMCSLFKRPDLPSLNFGHQNFTLPNIGPLIDIEAFDFSKLYLLSKGKTMPRVSTPVAWRRGLQRRVALAGSLQQQAAACGRPRAVSAAAQVGRANQQARRRCCPALNSPPSPNAHRCRLSSPSPTCASTSRTSPRTSTRAPRRSTPSSTRSSRSPVSSQAARALGRRPALCCRRSHSAGAACSAAACRPLSCCCPPSTPPAVSRPPRHPVARPAPPPPPCTSRLPQLDGERAAP